MSILDRLFGKPLPTMDEGEQRLGVATGVPTFGLDALSSAAYGPEAALTVLMVLGVAGSVYVIPVTGIVLALLLILFFSYRQTIAAYPGGGGSYTVASANLGRHAGVLAAAALMVDYLLDVAVGISAGVGALVSAVPRLEPHTLTLCLGILFLLALLNMRGIREAGVAFSAPTVAFTVCLLAVIVIGIVRMLEEGGHPAPVTPLPHPPAVTAVVGVTLWLLLRAFSSGCTALTGVEAVSNGVRAFRDPSSRTAQRTLAIIVFLLLVLLAGIAVLARAYGIVATPPGQPGYQSVLSMLTAAVVGRGWFYYVTIGSVVTVVALSANTAFADFPRLCAIVADDGFLPHFFAIRGRRLVFNTGILVLTALAALLLIGFDGITDHLIPLFAIGAFLAFTLSQAGMVMHWRREKGRGWRGGMVVNGIGAAATGATTCVVLVAKFTSGAWITVIAVPLLVAMMLAVRRQYSSLERQLALTRIDLTPAPPPIVVVPFAYWNRAVEQALCFACSISRDIRVVHIETGEPETESNGHPNWKKQLRAAATAAGIEPPQAVVVQSPYRFVCAPILDYVLRLETRHPGVAIAIVVPEIVARSWYHLLLHNHHATALKALLLWKGNRHIVIVNVPWYADPPPLRVTHARHPPNPST